MVPPCFSHALGMRPVNIQKVNYWDIGFLNAFPDEKLRLLLKKAKETIK
jgi:hypothetical protein